jgi:hypothetical protein
MHRPGIARVSSDRIILDGTTIEEVERYHLETLKLAVSATNEEYEALVARERVLEQQRQQAADVQRQRVEDTIGRLKFD